MEGQSTKPDATSSESAFAHLRRVIASLSAYIGARFELVAIEGQEAFVHYLKLLLWVGAAVLLMMFGYVFLCMGVVLLVASWTGMHTGWISLFMFLLHLVGVIVCLAFARNILKVPQFKVTLEELKQDQEWLR